MLGLRFERDPDRLQRTWSDSGPALVFPLESTVLTVRSEGLEERFDRASFVLVPARASWSLEVHSAVAPTVTLLVLQAARDAALKEYAPHFTRPVFDRVVSAPRRFARTRWVDELANRYLFERQVCEKHDSAAARFLETELTKELFFLGKEALDRQTRAAHTEQPTDLVRMAQAFIEQHLFEPLTVDQIANASHASASTLLRAFRRELKVPPTDFIRNRRLDEAMLLLESHKYSASEVAARVGYANLSGFTVAFSRRFGRPPSKVAQRASGTSVLPPHGAPPKRKPET